MNNEIKNEKAANNTTAAAIVAMLNIPSLDAMPEAVKTAANAEKQAAEVVKTAAAAAEQAQKDIAAAIAASDIATAQKALKAQSKAAAELDKARAAHKTAAAELEKAKEENPYKQPTTAAYCIVAAVQLMQKNGGKFSLTAKAVATAAITLMPEDSRPGTYEGVAMVARGVIETLNCIKIEK